MVSVSIFGTEVDSIALQLQQLQAQMASFIEMDSKFGSLFAELRGAVEEVNAVRPQAIAKVQAAARSWVPALFNPNDDEGNEDGGGNQPLAPAPRPGSDGQEGPAVQPVTPSDHLKIVEIVPELEPELNGQSTEIACLLGHHLCEGQLLEAPNGQRYEGSDERNLPTRTVSNVEVEVEAPEEPPYVELIKVSDAVAYQYKRDKDEIPCTYIGFKSRTRAEAWGRWFSSTNNIASGFELRAAKRLAGFKHEIKLWGLNSTDIQRLPHLDFAFSPSEQSIEAWIKVEEQVVVQAEEKQVEDAAPSPELPVVEKTHPVIDVADVPEGVSLLSTNDDRLIEYTCWVWTAAREKGVLAPKQRNVGRLFQTQSGIEAERARSRTTRSKTSQFFERTLDAVNYLIRSSDYRDAIAEGLKLLKSESEVEESESVAVTRAGDIASIATNPDLVKQESLFKEGDLVEINVTRPGNRTWNGLVGYVDGFTASKEVIVALKGNYRKKHFLEDELILIEYGPEQPVEETTVVIQPEVVQVTVEQPEPDSPKFRVNEKVEVISDRKGDELVWQTGVVTAVSSVGCAVDIDGKLYWFCLDEIVSLKDAARIQAEAKADLFPDGE